MPMTSLRQLTVVLCIAILIAMSVTPGGAGLLLAILAPVWFFFAWIVAAWLPQGDDFDAQPPHFSSAISLRGPPVF
jgi:hypothetical protein